MRFRFQSAPSGGLSIAPVLPLGGSTAAMEAS